MREPIKADDIRKGDLIRVEGANDRALEYRAAIDGDVEWWSQVARYYLLARPKPAVELPAEPTLGWLRHKAGGELLGVWCRLDRVDPPSVWQSERDVRQENVTTFTPAVAVPVQALEDLRSALDRYNRTGGFDVHMVARFIDDAHEANR